MARRRALRGVLVNFLTSFTNRSSDHDGYWLMGFIARDIDSLDIDLLDHPLAADVSTTARAVIHRARQVWNKQLEPARLTRFVRDATLSVSRHPSEKQALQNGFFKPGYEIHLDARVATDLGMTYVASRTLLAAPHDPRIESRSVRP